MRKIILTLFILSSFTYSYSQNKYDKKLVKNIKQVNIEINSIYKTLKQYTNKEYNTGFKERVSKSLLSKEEVTIIEKTKDSIERDIKIDAIIAQIKKEDKPKYLALSTVSFIKKFTIEKEVDKLANIFKKYGYLSKSRLDKLQVSEKFNVDINEVLLTIPSNYRKEIIAIVNAEYKANRLSNLELENIIHLLENN